ncbi:mycofactocin biosynthesis peptidyl-dipeptidase MftE [Leucobacter allii]|uniref:Mycofactocin biosynthesis peptidyl-dipeptidase MftE n=1 Tax=Leucobacter allii TaxID=2932247 RepID=A0ABY4FNC5_9MICO|nr:mycofactocin biosynthesis peptidyl-dipeptidase MftE [Leucobacter allii]UOQ57766.1 mycofactocin biosynthesis peptidyl-dipeptidase MftE [Leucobacter allii]
MTVGDADRAGQGAPLAERRWPAISGGALILPLGATEQHGPHLPLGTDADVAQAVARALAAGEDPAPAPARLLAPAIPYGASGEHADFPGTLSLGTAVLTELLVELGRSALRWAERVCIVNGHGGNVEALAAAVPRLRREGRDVAWLPCGSARIPGDAHAGRAETSLMLHLHPDRVAAGLAEAGDARPMRELLPELRARGVRAVSSNGVLGDPSGASADEGRARFAAVLAEAEERLRAWAPRDTDGMLALRDAV